MAQEPRTALISVYNKKDIDEFAQGLIEFGWRIISSGGTARVLKEAGVAVTDVAEITGYPAVLGHRVVTLAPQIHGGLLATEEMRPELNRLGWPYIDLCCVDFYPLSEAIKKPGATAKSVIDATDIGGPTMVRSAAKGGRIVIVDPEDRAQILAWLDNGEPAPETVKRVLAAKAEGIVAQYCLDSARFHSRGGITGEIIFEEPYSPGI